MTLTMAPTQHFSGRGVHDRNKTLWGSYAISWKIQGQIKQIYFGGDAAYSTHYKDIRKKFGAFDLCLLPIGAYAPRWFMKSVHMDPAEAVQAHLDLESKTSIGIHFGTFQLTEEAIDQPVIDLKKAIADRHLPVETFTVLGEGQTEIYEL